MSGDTTCAAIGHHRLSERMSLNVISAGIEDLPDNWTRFVIISSTPSEQDGREKTSMLFSLPDRPGSLVEVLQLLAHEGINMKKLESRPQRGEKWKYVFFVDVECDLSRQEYAKLVSDLSNACHSLRILGSYPVGPSSGRVRGGQRLVDRKQKHSNRTLWPHALRTRGRSRKRT